MFCSVTDADVCSESSSEYISHTVLVLGDKSADMTVAGGGMQVHPISNNTGPGGVRAGEGGGVGR